MPGSPNKTIIGSLVETLKQKVEPAKLYDALIKMNQDLNKTYNTLFDGPLPIVDAHNLTNVDATHLINIIPEVNLPNNLAFQDRENVFDKINSFITEDSESVKIGFGTYDDTDVQNRVFIDEPTSWFRLGPLNDGEFFLSQNYSWDGSNYTLDDILLSGTIIEFINGSIIFKHLFPAEGIYTGPHLAQTFSIDGRVINYKNFAQDASLEIIGVAPTDVVYVGDQAGTFTDLYRGHFAIANVADTKLPAGSAIADGIIAINKTPATATLVYFSKGLRYRLTGVAF